MAGERILDIILRLSPAEASTPQRKFILVLSLLMALLVWLVRAYVGEAVTEISRSNENRGKVLEIQGALQSNRPSWKRHLPRFLRPQRLI